MTGTWVHVVEPSTEQAPPGHFSPPPVQSTSTPDSPAAITQEPDNLPTFTRTTGGTITTFLPKEPPGSAPKPTRQPFADLEGPQAFSAPTTDLPAGRWPLDGPSAVQDFDELVTDVLPAGGLPIERAPEETPSMPADGPAEPGDDRYDSDAELDALLADLSAVVSPFLPTDDVEVDSPSVPNASVPGPVEVERLIDYPSPQQPTTGSILDDAKTGSPMVRPMHARPPVPDLPLGRPHEIGHPMDGPVGSWVRIFAVLLAVGLTAGAISYALMS